MPNEIGGLSGVLSGSMSGNPVNPTMRDLETSAT